MNKNILTPNKYELLDEDEQFYYDPEYAKYKIRKVRSYESCDLGYEHFMGWVEERVPIGDPVLYKRDNSIARHTLKLLQPSVIDGINKSNVLTERMLNKYYKDAEDA